MAFSFDQIFAADPSNPANIAQNAAITIFAPGDLTMTPLTITDPDGQPLTNPIPVNANGFGSAFAHATLDRVAWAGGGFTGFFTSYEGMKQVAVDAQAAAEAAADTAGTEAAAVATAAIGTATDEATAAAASAATAATNAASSATAAANAAALVGAPADSAIAAAVNGTGATKTALNSLVATAVSPKLDSTTAASTYKPKSDAIAPTEGHQRQKFNAGTASSVVWTGHSLAYGQDTTASGTRPAANGATETRSSTPPTEQFSSMLAYVAPGAAKPSVVNQGYPGDRTEEVLTRWASGVSGDVEIIWADTNDANNYAGFPSGPLTAAQTATNLQALLARSLSRGSQPVVIGSASINSGAPTAKTQATAEAMRQVCTRLGVPWFDVMDLVRVLDTGNIWVDGTHLKPTAYSTIGTRMAALFGPKGFNPPKAAPGTVFYPQHYYHAPVTQPIVARTNATDGMTWQLAGGSIMAVPVMITEPCEVIVKFHSETGVGVGQAKIIYGLGGSGKPTNTIVITNATGRQSGVRGPRLTAGPDVLIFQSISGTVEIDSIHFVPIRRSLRRGLDTTSTKHRQSELAGAVLNPVSGPYTSSWESRADEYSPLGCHDGTVYRAGKIDWGVRFTVPASGKFTGPVAYAGLDYGVDHMASAGYLLLCNNAGGLVIREVTTTGSTDLQTIASVFPASGTYEGVITFAIDGTGAAQVYVDGVAAGTTFTPKWTSYYPGIAAQSMATVRACSLTGYTGLI